MNFLRAGLWLARHQIAKKVIGEATSGRHTVPAMETVAVSAVKANPRPKATS